MAPSRSLTWRLPEPLAHVAFVLCLHVPLCMSRLAFFLLPLAPWIPACDTSWWQCHVHLCGHLSRLAEMARSLLVIGALCAQLAVAAKKEEDPSTCEGESRSSWERLRLAEW